jgi:hypothetical protein
MNTSLGHQRGDQGIAMKIVVVSSDYFVIGGLFSFHREIS